MKCVSCQFDNLDSQNFCGQCGARLSPAPTPQAGSPPASYTPPHLAQKILTSRAALEGERKLVTVLFCDIANSTQLATRVGAESMHALLNHFFELALAEVHRYEGTINQFLGDGFMALFGAPVAHEDHARRALLAALGIRQRLSDTPGEAAALREVRVRMGVNTGMVVVGKIGNNLRMDYTAVGDTTNLAARLQQQAQPGAIRSSEATQRAAVAHFEFKPLGKHALKGIAEPVEVYDLLKARATDDGEAPTQPGGLNSPLVGRNPELSILAASVDSLRQGRGGVVVLQGEAGVGKSRLAAEARRRAGAEGLLDLEGRALSFGRNLSYWPFIEILKECFGIEDNDSEAQAWGKLEEAARELFDARTDEIIPYLATVLSLGMTGEYEQRVKYLDPQALGRQVFLSMRQLFERLAQRRPILVVLEDWRWVDRSSVTLCEHLLRLTSSIPLMFWFVAREDPGEPTARIRATASRDPALPLQEIALAPLAADQSGVLVDNLLGTSDLPQAARSQIMRKTEGNPFFIEEIIRALIVDGTLVKEGVWRLAKPIDALALPDTVQGVIVARIDRLEEGVKSVLKLASVIGRSFFLRILQAISEAGEPLDSDLAELEQAELIRQRQQLPELEYIFKHALVQEAAYGSILAERRRTIHRSVAEAIERLFADRLDEFTSVLAYHYALAEDWQKAQAYLFKAGDLAGRMAADAEALEHYRQAEAAYMKVAAQALNPLERASLDRKLGQAFYGVGNYEQAIEHFSRALSHLGLWYPRTRWGVRRGVLKFLARHFLRRAKVRMRGQGKPTMDLSAAREVSAICHAMLWLDIFADQERMMLDWLIELHAGERSGDPVAQLRGLGALGLVFTQFGAHRLARKYISEASSIAHRSDHPAGLAYALFARGWLEANVGLWNESVRCLEQAASAYKRAGDIRGWGGPTSCLCVFVFLRADFSRVLTLASELVRVGQDAGDPHVASWGALGLGYLGLACGPLDVAATHLSTARELAVQNSAIRIHAMGGGVLGKCCLQQGRLDEASAIVADAVRVISDKKLRGFHSADPLNAAAALCLALVDRARGAPRRSALRDARRACRKALHCARNAVGWMPEALRLYGTLAWFSGDFKSARARWQQSIAAAEKFAFPVEQARTLLEMGSRLGDVALVDEATRVFAQTGAKVYLAFGLHARARMKSGPGADVGSTLQRYGDAILALDEVKAEYELGVAFGARAQLHKQVGRLEQARTDLASARNCFAAVRAAPEQVDIDRETIALG